jgi:threonyl-tRNA synthetase
VGYKLRQHFTQKGVYSIIIGDDEMAAGQVTVREKKSNQKMPLAQFIEQVAA